MKSWATSRLASPACVAALTVAIGAFCAPAFAQETSADPPAHISVVDGTATLERDGRPESSLTSMPLLAGDRLRTENGRIEVLFGDGATLHLDTYSTVDFQSDEVIRVLGGRVRLTIPGPARRVSYRIDTPPAWAEIQEPGEYRVALTRSSRDSQPGRDPQGNEVELGVLRGSATLMNEDGQTTLRAGERAFARGGTAPSYAYVYNSAAWDAFDRWSDARRADRIGTSAQYLPETVRYYSSTFDRYGSWRHDTSYGYVWYPTVSVGWRPYFYGRWASYPSFGWTWIGNDAWAWPTHHYGRWGFSAGLWFWVPGRTWGPAWVSWAYAPGYVSWCPLGWDNRPVIGFRHAGYYAGRYDPWHAWTVVPHQRFGSGYVNSTFVRGGYIDARTRDAFVVRDTAPGVRGTAVPRNVAPIYAAGTPRTGNGSGAAGGGRFGVQRGGDSGSRATVQGSVPETPRAGAADDAAAVFRSRRPSSSSTGAGYPPAARAPRESPEVVERMGTARERGGVPRSAEAADVPVHRGAVPRQPDAAAGNTTVERGRLDVPGYRRVPSAPQASPGASTTAERAWSVGDGQSPSRPGAEDRGPVIYRGGRVTPERQVPDGAGAPGRSPESGGYHAVPRGSGEASPPPSYRSYPGVIEHRGTPPPAAAPPREAGPPPSAAPPRGEAAPRGGSGPRADPPSGGEGSRARPSGGQGQSDRGGAVRRGRG